MKQATIRFLQTGEMPVLPGWTKVLPASWRAGYTVKHRPYRLEQGEKGITGILQTQREGICSAPWRKGALALLKELEKEGVSIVIPPPEGEFPRERLPFAEGRHLAALFAFEGLTEALRRQGKEPCAANYLITGDNPVLWERVLSSMGNEVNHLYIFTPQPEKAEPLTRWLYEERGLLAEVFSSPKHPALREADAVLSCGMEQRPYEYMLKKGCVWLDLAGNRPVLRRLRQSRLDVAAAEGFYFRLGTQQMEGRFAEAEAFLRCTAFRQSWERFPAGEGLFRQLKAEGFAVSGFSAFGKRVKIAKNQGENPFLPPENIDNAPLDII